MNAKRVGKPELHHKGGMVLPRRHSREEGENMNPYATLESIGVNPKGEDGHYRYYTDILEDLAVLWQEAGD